jgi:hypothetical protein
MKYKIYLDFDGTVVEHQHPRIGKYNLGAFKVIAKLQKAGYEIILNTYRADLKDGTLKEAIIYLNKAEKIDIITKIERKKIDPLPWNWKRQHETRTIFIDDICKGSPLKSSPTAPYDIVDWEKLDEEFLREGIY